MPVTVIFGATGGIGSALARRLADAGRQLHLVGRNGERLQALGSELGAGTSRCDVTRTDEIAAALDAVGAPIEAMAYAIGSIDLKPLLRTDEASFERAFRVNALGAALAAQAVLPRFSDKGGAMLFFSSVAVAQGFPNHAVVAMAKGAVEGLTRALAAELAPRIRVNCIAPSLTRTRLAETVIGSEQMARAIAAQHPLQRLGEADDIAALGSFLLSQDAAWMTGGVIGVDGGRGAIKGK